MLILQMLHFKFGNRSHSSFLKKTSISYCILICMK